MVDLEIIPLGVIHSPFAKPGECPRQGRFSDAVSVIEVNPAYGDALLGVEEGRSYLVLYEAHLADRSRLQTIPPARKELWGVFASRSPHRPNPINICVAQLRRREGNTLHVTGLDAVDGSHLIDMKPYAKDIDTVDDQVEKPE